MMGLRLERARAISRPWRAVGFFLAEGFFGFFDELFFFIV
jgi:hypothetical protein